MEEVSSSSRGVSSVDIGDSFTFVLTIDLSGIAVGQKSDLAIEFFAMDATNGTFGTWHVHRAPGF
jgi:hypothetical protein